MYKLIKLPYQKPLNIPMPCKTAIGSMIPSTLRLYISPTQKKLTRIEMLSVVLALAGITALYGFFYFYFLEIYVMLKILFIFV